MAGSAATEGFDRLKNLTGSWTGKTSKGDVVNVSYSLVSNGSALVETEQPSKEDSMVTVYHLDGQNLILTHYCSSGNQPRMKADLNSNNKNSLSFTMFDATNMPAKDAPHMNNLVVTFLDKDHFTQQWTFINQGKPESEEFTFERSK